MAAALADAARLERLEAAPAPARPFGLGLVTYNLARDWDLPTLLKNCVDTGFEGVELRTGHRHGVELHLTASERGEVRKRFADSPVKLLQLGSTYEFHAFDRAEVERNIEGCKRYIQLARDVGAPAVKVRPNGLQTKAGVPVEKTLDQIGGALGKLGPTAAAHDVEVRLEVHGHGTGRLEYIQRIMAVADHPKVVVNWNSNPTDLEGGTLEENFARVAAKVRHVHLHDLTDDYPWRPLFGLLAKQGYTGYCCAEAPESSDPLRVMRYFRALFLALQSA
jgi:sugar phosphate isomerase/epimerase